MASTLSAQQPSPTHVHPPNPRVHVTPAHTHPCSIERSDYVYKLVGSTLGPVCIVVLVTLGEWARALYYKGHLLRGVGIKYCIMMLFFILPTTSSIIMATFATHVRPTFQSNYCPARCALSLCPCPQPLTPIHTTLTNITLAFRSSTWERTRMEST